MYYTVGRFGQRGTDVLAVINSGLGNSRDVSISDSSCQNWTLIEDALPNTSGYEFVLRANDFWLTMSQSAAPPTIFQISYDDGQTWTPSSSLTSRVYDRVGFKSSSGLLIAVERGNTAKWATSTDGLTWAEAAGTIDGPSDITDMIYSPELDQFTFLSGVNINVSLNTRAFTTEDNGATWDITLGFGEYAGVADFCWAPSLSKFVAISTARTPVQTYPRYTWTSTDGKNWTKHSNVLPDLLDVRSIAWSEKLQLFVVVAFGYNNAITDRYLTSPDGINWTERTFPSTGSFIDVMWNGAVFCAIENGNNVNNAFVSVNGTSWTTYSMGAQLEWSSAATRGSYG